MRRIIILLASLALMLGLASCGSANKPATTPEEAQPASIGYARLPDGRVLTCITSRTYDNRRVYDCDWDKPFSTNGTAPAGAEIKIVESFEYVKDSDGNTLQCISSITYDRRRALDCDWGHPVKPS